MSESIAKHSAPEPIERGSILSDIDKQHATEGGMMKRILVLIVVAVVVFCNGCVGGPRNKQLEKVAKDWSLVIRASQVIPVYPLTEDVQPGDVLLVNTPIEEQVAIYKDKGFLPLDQLLVRLYSKDLIKTHSTSESFVNFYNDRYETDQRNGDGLFGSVVFPPAQWQNSTGSNAHQWDTAPRASFPTYQFSAQKGAGVNLAIPIQGVPFSLGLMNTGRASGTVTIADANTFGLDNVKLWRLVTTWAANHRDLLIPYGPTADRQQYLRVVSRVYVAGRVGVTINNAEETGGQADAGADRPVDLLSSSERDKYTEMLNAVNVSAGNLLGAKVKVAAASSRSVTLSETFERPLVIGYIGFDMPILKNGQLGAPISTLTQLTGQKQPVTSLAATTYRLAALAHMYNALKEIKTEQAKQLRENLDELDHLLPDTYPFTLYEFRSQDKTEIVPSKKIAAGKRPGRNGFNSVTDYLGHAQTTVVTLEDFLQCQGGSPSSRDTEELEKLKQNLDSAKQALTTLQERLNREPSLSMVIDYVFLGN